MTKRNTTKMVTAELAGIWADWKVAVATSKNPTGTDAFWALREWSCDRIVTRTSKKLDDVAACTVDQILQDLSHDEHVAMTISDYIVCLDAQIQSFRADPPEARIGMRRR